MNRAEDEMVEGYIDGRDPDNPEPSANRSAAYRHGFQSGRDDLSKLPKGGQYYKTRVTEADRIIAENAD